MNTKTKPKRARTKKGRYVKDDKSTPNINEAWIGGKAPKKTAKKKKRGRPKKKKMLKGKQKSLPPALKRKILKAKKKDG